jgi:FKBP-type peptidyl-prolyl cis-trans isomerase FkpA
MKKIILILIPLLFFGCKKEDQSKIDNDIIKKYIADNGLIAQSTSSGLYYVITTEGSGDFPTINSNVTVNYKGYLTDKIVFDQSSSPVTFPLSNLIKGWQEGIQLMKPGGKALLLIPSKLGYGSRSLSKIPANSVLIFEIELISFSE